MSHILIVLYVAGWLITTVALLRGRHSSNERGRGHTIALGIVSGLCAIALAAVWPLSGWFLPMIRAALDGP